MITRFGEFWQELMMKLFTMDTEQTNILVIVSSKKIILLEVNKNLQDAESVFGRFKSVDTSKTSCFMPVKSILMPSSDSEMIHELIPELYEAQLIGDSFQLNLENLLNKSGNFELRKYSKEMIFSYIQALKNRDATGKQNSITGH